MFTPPDQSAARLFHPRTCGASHPWTNFAQSLANSSNFQQTSGLGTTTTTTTTNLSMLPSHNEGHNAFCTYSPRFPVIEAFTSLRHFKPTNQPINNHHHNTTTQVNNSIHPHLTAAVPRLFWDPPCPRRFNKRSASLPGGLGTFAPLQSSATANNSYSLSPSAVHPIHLHAGRESCPLQGTHIGVIQLVLGQLLQS